MVWMLSLLVAQANAVNCGDTLTANTTLLADVVCAPGFAGDAVTIGADNITLDGNGFRIVMTGAGFGSSGVRIDAKAGVTLTDVAIENDAWAYGIVASGTTDLQILGGSYTLTDLLATAIDLNSGLNSVIDGAVILGDANGLRLTNEVAPVLRNSTLQGDAALHLLDSPILIDGTDGNTFVPHPNGSQALVLIESDDVVLPNLDLSAETGGTVVFVEVKTRRNRRFGAPEEAVSARKRARLVRGAAAWLRQHPRPYRSHRPYRLIRFDVISCECRRAPDGQETDWQIRHFEGAFDASG